MSLMNKKKVGANAQLREPTQMHKKRNVFFKLLSKKGSKYAVEKATKVSILRKVLRRIKRLSKKI